MSILESLLDIETSNLVRSNRELGCSDVASAKMVRKPWGEERWMVPEGAPFGFKLIVIKGGCRTSLQYHEQKEEANLILSGTGTMILGGRCDDEHVKQALVPGMVVHVRPGNIHRVEASTDLVIVEVSTAELDDVVRIADDTGRGDGRVQAEHMHRSE